jgi:hypothetical protein
LLTGLRKTYYHLLSVNVNVLRAFEGLEDYNNISIQKLQSFRLGKATSVNLAHRN